jgi:chitodextrinase/C1A family cysteine protease
MKQTTIIYFLLLISLPAFNQKVMKNPSAVYCETLGYEYMIKKDAEGNQIGMCRLPNGEVVNAWDFYKGKVAKEFSYPAKKGYEIETVVEKINGYVVEKMVCTRTLKGVKESLSLEELMEKNNDKLQLETKSYSSNIYETAKIDENFVVQESLPTTFDWRDYNGNSYIGGVRNQGTCGSCYAFGAAACAEGTYNFATGNYNNNTADFSEAYIAWCLSSMSEYSNNFYGCEGADYTYSELDALCEVGIIDESYFPYTESDNQSCPSAASSAPKTQFDSWYRVSCSDIDAIKTAISTYGVVDAAVYVTSSFENYSGGIFSDSYTSCSSSPCYYTPTNHAIALVGWGTDATTGDYWILRNSWGTSWGENGYMRIDATSARVACEVCYLVYDNGTSSPTVTTNAISSISTISAIGGGEITSNGGATITASGIVYSTSQNPTLSSGSVLSTSPVTTTGSYSLTMSGLSENTTYYVRAYATNSAGTSYGSQVSFITSSNPDTEAPTAPTNLASSDVSSTSVMLSWSASTDNVGVSVYNVYQDGTLLGTTANTSFSVSGLSASTTYSFYVTAEDASGNVSSASSSINVTTSETSTTYCASKGNNVQYEWIDLVELNTINNTSTASSGYTDYTNLSTDLKLGSSYTINFSAGFSSSSYTEFWYIWIDYDKDGTFETDELINSSSSSSSSTLSNTFTVPTTASLGSTRMRVTMKYNSAPTACETFSYGEVEDYTINLIAGTSDTEAPSAPKNLASSDVSATSATLSWSSSTDNVGVTGYNVYQDQALIGTTSETSYSVTGLSPVTTYSFYVTAEDEAGNISEASSSLNITTPSATITYCSSAGNNVTYEWIDLVQLNTINNSSSATSGYSDYTDLSTELGLGTTYDIYFSAGFRSSSYTEYWYIWIDFDQDGTFEDSEIVVSGYSSSSATLSSSFTVPASATLGSTRMRVTMKYNSAPTACETFNYGEVEDYTVVIKGISQPRDTEFYTDVKKLGLETHAGLRIFPNPVNDQLNVMFNNEFNNNTVKIYSSEGALLKTTIMNKPIDVSSLPEGLYIISVDDPKEPITTKFIKR